MEHFNLKILAGIAAALFVGCAGTPRVAPRFVAPSTAPIAKAQAAIAKKQAETRGHIQKAQQIVRTLTIRLPEDKLKIDALTAELDAANQSNDELRAQNDFLKGVNESLGFQITAQTHQANLLADNYDKQGVQIKALELSRHKYVKAAWLFGSILAAEVLAAAGFIALKFGFL